MVRSVLESDEDYRYLKELFGGVKDSLLISAEDTQQVVIPNLRKSEVPLESSNEFAEPKLVSSRSVLSTTDQDQAKLPEGLLDEASLRASVDPGTEALGEIRKDTWCRQALVAAQKIWANTIGMLDILPENVLVLIGAIRDLLERRRTGFVPATARRVIEDILVEKLIVPALDEPILYEIADDCVVPAEYLTKVAAGVRRILRGVLLGRPLPPHDQLSVSTNRFISAAQ